MTYQVMPSQPCNGEAMDCRVQDTTSTMMKEETISVPQDFPTLQEAISFANSELSKTNTRSRTIHVLIEPNHQCLVQEPIVVDYGMSSMCTDHQLVIDVVHHRPTATADHHHHPHQSQQQEHAQVTMDTTIPNQPLIRLVRGNLTIRNIHFEHCSPVDISLLLSDKNSNAAIVVDPTMVVAGCATPVGSTPAKFTTSSGKCGGALSLHLQHLTVTSYSGRGIINRCLTSPHLVQMEDVFMPRMWQ